jgi:hypothetical protein
LAARPAASAKAAPRPELPVPDAAALADTPGAKAAFDGF